MDGLQRCSALTCAVQDMDVQLAGKCSLVSFEYESRVQAVSPKRVFNLCVP